MLEINFGVLGVFCIINCFCKCFYEIQCRSLYIWTYLRVYFWICLKILEKVEIWFLEFWNPVFVILDRIKDWYSVFRIEETGIGLKNIIPPPPIPIPGVTTKSVKSKSLPGGRQIEQKKTCLIWFNGSY